MHRALCLALFAIPFAFPGFTQAGKHKPGVSLASGLRNKGKTKKSKTAFADDEKRKAKKLRKPSRRSATKLAARFRGRMAMSATRPVKNGPYYETRFARWGNRRVRVSTPPGYDDPANAGKSYPVMYLADGQNVLSSDGDRNALGGLGRWDMDLAVADRERAGGPAAIVVAIDNAGNFDGRMWEYAPSRARVEDIEGIEPGDYGGGAKDYVDFVAGDVKGWVDQNFRTKRGREHTAIGGSSMGGLVSLHAGIERSDVFGRVMAMSPSLWWDDQRLMRDLFEGRKNLPDVKIYIDSGGRDSFDWRGTNDGRQNVDHLKGFLENLRDGNGQPRFQHERNLKHWYEDSHAHNEAAWRERFPRAYEFLFADE